MRLNGLIKIRLGAKVVNELKQFIEKQMASLKSYLLPCPDLSQPVSEALNKLSINDANVVKATNDMKTRPDSFAAVIGMHHVGAFECLGELKKAIVDGDASADSEPDIGVVRQPPLIPAKHPGPCTY